MTNKLHICILTTAHPIDDVRVNYKFAAAFVSAGFRVTWVGPGHAFFDSVAKKSEGINFFLAPPLKNRKDRALSRYSIKPIAKKVRDVDVYYSPEPDSAEVALLLAKKNGAKVIFDIHEIYHGALLDRWLFGFNLPFVREYFRRRVSSISAKCDLVIGVSAAVLGPYLTNSAKGLVVRSCAPKWFADNYSELAGASRSDVFRVMHGKNDVGRGSLEVVEAAALVAKKVSAVSFVMFSMRSHEGASEDDPVSVRIRGLHLENMVEVRQGVPMREMPGVLRSCDVGLIAYGRNLGVDSLPNRLFEYMAAGLAVIAPSYATEIAAIIDAEGCGLLVDFENPEEIAASIIFLKKNPGICAEMGRRGRRAFVERHNWEVEVRPLIDVISSWG